MLFVGLIVEKYYVSRPTLFVNSAALLLHAKQFSEVSLSFAAFVLIGLSVGIFGVVSYVTGDSLPDAFYQFAYFTYASAPIAAVMLVTFIFSPNVIWLSFGLIVGAVANSKILTLFPEHIAPVTRFDYAVRLADWLFGTDWRY